MNCLPTQKLCFSSTIMSTPFLFLSLLGIGSFIITSSAAPTYNGYYCPNNAAFQSNAELRNNLNLLLSSLTSNASATVASGLLLYRGDVSFAVCHQCPAAAAADISGRCRNQTASIIWYDERLLGYTNSYFNPVGVAPRVNLWDGNNDSTSDLDSFNRTLFGLLDGLAGEALGFQSDKKFMTGERIRHQS